MGRSLSTLERNEVGKVERRSPSLQPELAILNSVARDTLTEQMKSEKDMSLVTACATLGKNFPSGGDGKGPTA